ncbi:response regulator [Streptomyces candidus]|uniref:DNA-binding NarL/FixJ family response regulator n=1 Tax=Streptomyces candidus TaxID=67283 RepID=A0A7X0LSA7_9ACTN|nr:response regulator transcription factor [Streptomyces candidus]MBB6439002.1 DNA-binding NarL/FixJ family response regulator [Streptomyces candidus]GHH44570.1 DNA-binding response regulator [Streptomyces candidus]
MLIVDDQPLVRRGLSLILSPDPAVEVVGEAENGAQAVTLARQLAPDVAVMDIRMPVLDGVDATRELATAAPDCRVLALSTFDLDEYVVGALRAGAYGFLPKDSSPEDLSAAIRTVHTGEAAVAPRLLTRLIAAYVRTPVGARPGPEAPARQLTPREVEVWRLMATGLDNTEISRTMDLSLSTVKNYITSIFGKLAVRDRAQAVIAAYESGLVTARAAEETGARAGNHPGPRA